MSEWEWMGESMNYPSSFVIYFSPFLTPVMSYISARFSKSHPLALLVDDWPITRDVVSERVQKLSRTEHN